jgi:hypothetical protein
VRDAWRVTGTPRCAWEKCLAHFGPPGRFLEGPGEGQRRAAGSIAIVARNVPMYVDAAERLTNAERAERLLGLGHGAPFVARVIRAHRSDGVGLGSA